MITVLCTTLLKALLFGVGLFYVNNCNDFSCKAGLNEFKQNLFLMKETGIVEAKSALLCEEICSKNSCFPAIPKKISIKRRNLIFLMFTKKSQIHRDAEY